MKYILATFLGVMMFTASAMAAEPDITDYSYHPDDALHPFKLISLAGRPPLAVTSVFVKGTYFVFDVDPIRRLFNIESHPSMYMDEDY